MPAASGNLFSGLSAALTEEAFTELLATPGLLIERIVSTGQATPPGEWLEQDRAEWVILLKGAAGLRFEGEAASRTLAPGDWIAIPPRARHRVEWTAAGEATLWLAVHHG
jgi:cupin 2 domain-containing protein